MTRSAAFFDLDKTIIARSSSLAFSRPFYASGLINRRTVLRSAYAQFVYLVGGADHDQMERMREYLQSMVAGWPVAQVREVVAETLHELIDPIVYDEAVTLIEEHRAAGRDIVIVSSSGAEVVEPIGLMLGADRVVATRMVIEDGRYTGEIEYYAYGPTKADAIREMAAEHGYDLAASYAYSDSQTDLPDARGGRASDRGQPRPRAGAGGVRARVAGAPLQPPGGDASPTADRARPRPAAGSHRSRRRRSPGRDGRGRRHRRRAPTPGDALRRLTRRAATRWARAKPEQLTTMAHLRYARTPESLSTPVEPAPASPSTRASTGPALMSSTTHDGECIIEAST